MSMVLACTAPNQGREPVPDPANPPAAQSSATPRHDVGAPVRVQVSGPPQVTPGTTIEVRAEIERSWAAVHPLQLDVQVPQGVRLVSGAPKESLNDAAATRFERSWLLHVDAVPGGDFVVVVDWQTSGAGFHAAIPYRFGRPEPKLAAPKSLGPEIVLPNGVSLGQPIQMGPETVR
jgi:hypothetical protein